jgi:nucleoid-associated protein YgaU
LLAIAARELGDADRWVELAELNGLRDPRAITPGQVIRLP